jgi:hypothetical protein
VEARSGGHARPAVGPSQRQCPSADGNFGYMPTWSRLVSDYLAAALPLGLQVLRCEEPRRPSPLVDDDGTDLYDGAPRPGHIPGNPPNIWALYVSVRPPRTRRQGNPAAIIWHFQLSSD